MLEGVIPQNKVKTFKTRDGVEVSYRQWTGKKEQDVIVYIHGLQSHVGWFIESGNLLNHKGFNIYAVDRRGSGMNHTNRGHMENYGTLIDDLREVIEMAKSRHPGKKVFLIGSCWGGKVAVTFAERHKKLLAGLILVTPAIKTKVDLPIGEKVDIAFSNIFRPRKLFDVPLDDCMFTRNPRYAEFIKKDDLKLKKVTARFFFETQMMNFRFNKIAPRIHIPVLVLLAGDDRVVDNKGIKKWFNKLGAMDKTIKLYEDSYHCLQFEETKNITNHIADWVKAR